MHGQIPLLPIPTVQVHPVDPVATSQELLVASAHFLTQPAAAHHHTRGQHLTCNCFLAGQCIHIHDPFIRTQPRTVFLPYPQVRGCHLGLQGWDRPFGGEASWAVGQ